MLDEVARTHRQVTGEPFDIYIAENGAGRLAAIGALQAIDLREHLIVQLMHGLVEVFGRTSFKALKELLKPLAIVEGALSYLRWLNHREQKYVESLNEPTRPGVGSKLKNLAPLPRKNL